MISQIFSVINYFEGTFSLQVKGGSKHTKWWYG